MVLIAVAASASVVSREIRFEPSRVSLVTTCWSSSRVSHFDHAEHDQQDERQHHGELDEALSAGAAEHPESFPH